MKATVLSTNEGIIKVRVRRNYIVETLNLRHYDLKPGDRVEVKRQTNNPYLVRVNPSK